MTINGHTILTGLLGSPVSHSVSPLMHNEAFRLLGLNYAYLCFDVGTDTLQTAVSGLKALGARGFNCTMPDKTLMCELCDKLSPAAELIGAVNTVVNDNGILTGHNTDGIGYMMSVKDAGFDIIRKKMTLLGGGGAASAVIVQAALDGVSAIDIFCRQGKSWDKMLVLSDKLNKQTTCKVTLYDIADLTQLRTSLLESAIVTNASSVGMAPDTEHSLINDTSLFHEDLIVSDLIYNPRETLLMKLAKEAHCPTFNGMYMLLYQGAEAFRIWTGQDMPVAEIKKAFFS